MLASPFYPTTPTTFPTHTDETPAYRPAKSLEDFKTLLPPVEFVEGSSSGTLAVAEGRYEPINVPVAKTPKFQPKGLPASSAPRNGKTTTRPLYEGALKTSWLPGAKIGCGLNNIGNTCFLNSALQCLLHTPPVMHLLHAHGQSDTCRVKSNEFCAACALRRVFIEMQHHGRSFTPSQITSKLQFIAKQMRRGRQEDSHEFLRYVIDALQKSCLAGYPPKLDTKLAETTWVHQVFGGRLRSRVHCKECEYNSDTYDRILDLNVDIQNCTTLREALRKFVAVDYLRGANKYKCEKCKKPVVAEKRFTIEEAPLVLTVHLKRFSPLGKKIGHQLEYGEKLDLSPFMSEGVNGRTYSLYGVICHAGGGPNSGHYYAYVKATNGANEKWYEMNDESVTPSGRPVNKKTAYMLFYIQEKGQALERLLDSPTIVTKKGGIVANMKKRKVIEDDDLGEKAGAHAANGAEKKRFIGPLLPAFSMGGESASGSSPAATPPPSSIARSSSEQSVEPPATKAADPQAAALQRKIAAAKKPPSAALHELAMYDDSTDADDKPASGDEKENGGVAPSTPPPPPQNRGIPAASFYGASNAKKRKSPASDESDDDEAPPRARPAHSPKSERRGAGPKWRASFGGGGNPYKRLSGSNDLRRHESPKKFVQNRYGGKNRNRRRAGAI